MWGCGCGVVCGGRVYLFSCLLESVTYIILCVHAIQTTLLFSTEYHHDCVVVTSHIMEAPPPLFYHMPQ